MLDHQRLDLEASSVGETFRRPNETIPPAGVVDAATQSVTFHSARVSLLTSPHGSLARPSNAGALAAVTVASSELISHSVTPVTFSSNGEFAKAFEVE